MTEFAIFTDEGILEDGFTSEVSAEKRLAELKIETGWEKGDVLEVAECCCDHPEERADCCDQCEAESEAEEMEEEEIEAE